MDKLFGTDGIRGVAGKYPMTVEMALCVGRALVTFLKRSADRPQIIVGQDTRISGDMLSHAFMAGVSSQGGDICPIGVVPTPAVARMTVARSADAGVMISASHNPYEDNGIKIFDGQGMKLVEKQEAAIEALILSYINDPAGIPVADPGRVMASRDASKDYISFLKGGRLHGDIRLNDLHVIIDCGHGATYKIAPRLYRGLGMRVKALHISPDGRNINAGCGSEHPEILARAVRDSSANIGLAFDGDGDRVIAVDETGRVLSGDILLAICARHLKAIDRLPHQTAVSTVMSNIGLGLSLKDGGIRHLTTDVGDRHVMQKMLETGAAIGGEDSGHMIFSDHHTTGDGIFTGLRLLEVMAAEGQKLSYLTEIINIYPQAKLNVNVASKPPLDGILEIMSAIQTVEAELGDSGRVLVRYSGTQSCCRVMVEGPTDDITSALCRRIADVVLDKLG